MKKIRSALATIIIFLAALRVSFADDALRQSGVKPIPDGIKIGLISDKTNYFLGENILFYYRIENTGSKPFHISVGGDYRGSTRADRFEVTATSIDGKKVADPTPFMRNMGGGLMPDSEIKPGDEWFENVYVIKYCRFETPGIYTIDAFHDLGFGKRRGADPREVSRTIRLQAPTEKQAREILIEDQTAKPYNGNTWGKKDEVRLDYRCIRYPTFLPALIERAQNGDQNALEGIASIGTLDATRALVNLLGHTNTALATQAAAKLEVRLPHPATDFQAPWGDMKKQFIVENAWEKTLVPHVRDYAVRLLAGTNRGDFMVATSLLRCIGTQREISALTKALEFAIVQTNAEFVADLQYPSPKRACDTLVGTALTIDPNLDIAASDVQSAGQRLLFILKHGGSDRIFTKEDETMFVKFLQDPLAYLRMKALESLPKSIPSSLEKLVTKRMTDANIAVQNYAFLAADRMNQPQHREIALAVLKSADEYWLRRTAHSLAIKYGARYECATAWASHLVAPRDMNDYLPHDVVRHLFTIIVGDNTSGNLETPKTVEAAQKMREHWEKFLAANKDKIEAGYEFKRNELPEDLGLNF